MNVKFSKLLQNIKKNITYLNLNSDPIIEEIFDDSREVKKGSLFIAIKGREFDGHDFIQEVEKKGAVGLIVGQKVKTNLPFAVVKDTRKTLVDIAKSFYKNPTKNFKFIGVTGTKGKTTVTTLIFEILKAANLRPILYSSLGYYMENQRTQTKLTTPNPLFLFKTLKEAQEKGFKFAVIEVSSIGLEEKRLSFIEFDISGFTNLGTDHLDYHKTKKDYLKAKSKLFCELTKKDGICILNSDDENYKYLKEISMPRRVISYSLESESELKPDYFSCSFPSFFILNSERFEIASFGRYNILNALCVLGLIKGIKEKFGISIDKEIIKKVLRETKIEGRLQVINLNPTVIIDYAHTPESLKESILAIKERFGKDVISVFGCGGQRFKEKRPIMGRVATELSKYVIITSDNPRKENPLDIIKDIEKGIEKKNYEIIESRKEAIKRGIEIVKENGCVLAIFGKGHENYQIIGDKKIPFSDKEVALSFIK